MRQALQDPPKLRKRQKLYVQAETKQGKLLWQAAARVRMQPEEDMQVRFHFGPPEVGPPSSSGSSSSSASMEQMEVTDFDALEEEVQAQDDEVLAMASQVDPNVLQMPPEPGYDSLEDMWAGILDTKNGRAWYLAWKQGQIDDAQVDQRFGMVVLQNFQARWQMDARASSLRPGGDDGTSAASAQIVDTGEQVNLSAPTQLVALPGASAERDVKTPVKPDSDAAGSSGDLLLLTSGAPGSEGNVAGPDSLAQQGGSGEVTAATAEGSLAGDGAAAETTVNGMEDDELDEGELTVDDDSTWTGRAMIRWQREGRLY